MSDNVSSAHKHLADKARPSGNEGAAGDTWAQISRESNAHPMTNLQGQVCKVQPKENQQAMLISGHKPKGCDFKDFDPNSSDGRSIMNARDSAMHLQVTLNDHGKKSPALGSGVMIGQSGDKCLVATDNHVVGGINSMKVESIVAHKDGKSYPAKKEITDVPNDRAVISFKIPSGDNVCKPAPFAESADQTGRTVATGFPRDSDALTAAPGAARGLAPLSEVMGRSDPREKMTDDPDRRAAFTKSNTLEGMSGGPIWNSKNEVYSLVGGGVPGIHDLTYGNPVVKSDVNRWIKQVGDKDKAEHR